MVLRLLMLHLKLSSPNHHLRTSSLLLLSSRRQPTNTLKRRRFGIISRFWRCTVVELLLATSQLTTFLLFLVLSEDDTFIIYSFLFREIPPDDDGIFHLQGGLWESRQLLRNVQHNLLWPVWSLRGGDGRAAQDWGQCSEKFQHCTETEHVWGP